MSEPKRSVGLVPGEAREGPGRRLAPERLEGGDDGLLEHVEDVLALDERHLDVELAELELAVGAEILVPPAGGDLVVAVEPADLRQLLEQLRRLREREEAAGLEPHRHEEVAGALGRALRHARRPDVDEAELVHPPPDRGDHAGARAGGCAASARCAGRASGSGAGGSRRRCPRPSWNGSGSERETMRSVSTCTSISPVGRFGLTASARAADDLALGLENELVPDRRARSPAASAACSGLITSWIFPE